MKFKLEKGSGGKPKSGTLTLSLALSLSAWRMRAITWMRGSYHGREQMKVDLSYRGERVPAYPKGDTISYSFHTHIFMIEGLCTSKEKKKSPSVDPFS